MASSIIPFFSIKPLTREQLDTAVKFLFTMWHDTYHELDSKIRDERTCQYFENYLEKRMDRCWIALSGKQLVGLTSVSANCIDDLWVSKRFQRRNIGNQLVDKVIDSLQNKDINAVQVGCESFNQPAINFFNKLNWHKIGSQPLNIMPGKQVEVIVFGKKI